VIDGYSTDGLIAGYDLVVLRDDQRFFPPYEAAALVSGDLAERRPDAIAALTELSSRLDEETMRRLNRRLEVDREPVERIAGDALAALGLTAARADAAEPARLEEGSFLRYLWERRAQVLGMARRHLLLVVLSLAAAIAAAVPLGLALERVPRGAEVVVRGAGVLQTLPSIALLAFMIPLLGIGVLPAVVALFLYSLYPILRNTYTGVRDAAPDAVAAGRALGMTPRQILGYIRLPLAAPVIMAGIRTAAVINVGTATLAAFIGAGGLGDPIAAGLALSDTRMILSGAVPAALLALGVDGALGVVERVVRPGPAA
jgi:osmoprotectant transport system permease protein